VLGRVFGLRTCAGRLAPSPEVTPCLSGQVGACTAPCAGRVDEAAYARQVDGFLAFLDGRDAGMLDVLAARRDRLAGVLRFEAAGGVQRDLQLLEEVRRRRQTLSWVVTRQNFVVLLPTVAHDAAHLYAVLGGRLALEARITASADLVAAVAFVRERFVGYQALPLRREEVDGTTILAAWLRDREANQGILLPLDGPDAIAERFDELAVTVRDLRLPGPLPRIDGLA